MNFGFSLLFFFPIIVSFFLTLAIGQPLQTINNQPFRRNAVPYQSVAFRQPGPNQYRNRRKPNFPNNGNFQNRFPARRFQQQQQSVQFEQRPAIVTAQSLANAVSPSIPIALPEMPKKKLQYFQNSENKLSASRTVGKKSIPLKIVNAGNINPDGTLNQSSVVGMPTPHLMHILSSKSESQFPTIDYNSLGGYFEQIDVPLEDLETANETPDPISLEHSPEYIEPIKEIENYVEMDEISALPNSKELSVANNFSGCFATDFPTIPNGQILSDGKEKYENGETTQFACDFGYEDEGNFIFCTNSQWLVDGVCVKSDISETSGENRAELMMRTVSTSTTTESTTSTETTTTTTSTTTTKPIVTPSTTILVLNNEITRSFCPAYNLRSVTNGFYLPMDSDQVPFGGVANIQCRFGYSSRYGSGNVTCQENEYWTEPYHCYNFPHNDLRCLKMIPEEGKQFVTTNNIIAIKDESKLYVPFNGENYIDDLISQRPNSFG